MSEMVAITGLRRVRDPKPNKGGSSILAHFDCEARGLRFVGCCFVRTSRGGLVAWLPKLDGKDDAARSVTFTDDSLRHAMMLHAREAYRALGGTDAEWIGKSVPMGPCPVDADGWPLHEGAEPVGVTNLTDFLAPVAAAAQRHAEAERG